MPELPSMSSREKLEKSLSMLGFGRDRRTLSVLRAMLNAQSSLQRPVDAPEVCNGLLQVEPAASAAQTWVRKVLEALVNMRMVTVESDIPRRKRYSADANTIVTGLEGLKYRTLTRLETQRRLLQEELSLLSTGDFGHVARSLAHRTRNDREQPRSRLLKGLDAYREITSSEIYGRAGSGDIVRVARLWLKPFMSTAPEALEDLLRAVERGAKLQFCLTADVLAENDLLASGMPEAKLIESFARVRTLREEGASIDVRICIRDARTYHFSSLNNESMVILLSEDPLAATWVSHSFNPGFIKSAIASFDCTWEQSVSVFDSPRLLIKRFPGIKSGNLVSAMFASQKRKDGKGL